MKFTVPAAQDRAQAQTVLQSVRDFLAQQGLGTEGEPFSRIAFKHNGKFYDLAVGDRHPDLGELVVIILKASGPDLYYVCTANRGVVRGDPYLVGAGPDTAVIPFEPD
jgi:hypothetical protein